MLNNDFHTDFINENDNVATVNNLNIKINTIALPESLQTSKNCILIDKDTATFPLKIRKWEEGDYFIPLGMKGKKKLSNFFIDEKFSLLDKEKTLLLCNENNDIIWIIGHRIDNRFKITKNTKRVLKIEVTFN